MLRIKTDDGCVYEFKKEDYTEYTITGDFIVVKNENAWIGVFNRLSFVSLVIEKDEQA